MKLEVFEFTIVKKYPERKYIITKPLKKTLIEEITSILRRER